MIRLAEGYAARDAAAEPARARIDADIERADPALRPALRYLRESLFDPGVVVADLMRRATTERTTFFQLFRKATGASPRDYLGTLRLETAAVLLRTTSVPIGEVSSLTGYASFKTFRLTFARRFRVPPSKYRAQNSESKPRFAEGLLSVEAPLWHQLFSVWMEAEQRDRSASSLVEPEIERGRRRRAEHAWDVAKGLTPAARARLVAFVGRTTPDLPEILFERSRTEGRNNRVWGIEIAELALAAIPTHTNWVWTSQAIREMRLRALAWLGNAYRLAFDLARSGSQFDLIRLALAESDGQTSPSVLAEIGRLESSLLWFRGEYSEAIRAATHAISHARKCGDDEQLCTLHHRRAKVLDCQGKAREAIEDLETARILAERTGKLDSLASIHLDLVSAHIDLRDPDAAEPHWSEAKKICSYSQDIRMDPAMLMVEGQLHWLRHRFTDAEALISKAIRAFERLDNGYYFLWANVVLCLVRFESGKRVEALSELERLLPALRIIHADETWTAVVHRLRNALHGGRVHLTTLLAVRDGLRWLAARRIG